MWWVCGIMMAEEATMRVDKDVQRQERREKVKVTRYNDDIVPLYLGRKGEIKRKMVVRFMSEMKGVGEKERRGRII